MAEGYKRTAYTKAYLMIQVPLPLYFSPREKWKASVQNVQELYPMLPKPPSEMDIYTVDEMKNLLFN